MPKFKPFKGNSRPKKPGFYVLKYREGHETPCYIHEGEHHGGNIYSYPTTYHNDRDKDGSADFGLYVWVNSFSSHCHGPVEFRKMGVKEALAFSETLYMFGRPSWAHKTGRKHLTPADVK